MITDLFSKNLSAEEKTYNFIKKNMSLEDKNHTTSIKESNGDIAKVHTYLKNILKKDKYERICIPHLVNIPDKNNFKVVYMEPNSDKDNKSLEELTFIVNDIQNIIESNPKFLSYNMFKATINLDRLKEYSEEEMKKAIKYDENLKIYVKSIMNIKIAIGLDETTWQINRSEMNLQKYEVEKKHNKHENFEFYKYF